MSKNNSQPKKKISRKTLDKSKLSKAEENLETLSCLLKEFEDSNGECDQLLNSATHWISKTRLKNNWSGKYILASGRKTDVEVAAHNAANYMEKIQKELEENIATIQNNKDRAKEFARNSFLYLNKVHEGTCLGEAGKIMLKLFDQGKLTSKILSGLIEHAEHISINKSLPFANQLGPNHKKAIKFMDEEKKERILPVLTTLLEYKSLKLTISKWLPLMEALVLEKTKKAQEIVDSMP